MKKIMLLTLFVSFLSYANDNQSVSGCKAYFKSSELGGKIKDYDIESISSKDNVHYSIEVKQKGSTRYKFNNYPYPNTHKFIDIKCSDQKREYYWKKVLKI